MSDEAAPIPDFRRIWKRRTGAQGSSTVTLLAFDVLYDAGRPLTVDELVTGLVDRLDPTQRGYVEAWCLRNKAQKVSSKRIRTGHPITNNGSAISAQPIETRHAVRRWISQIFLKRLYDGESLLRDGDRIRPGPVPPKKVLADGRLVPYTPEMRTVLVDEQHDTIRAHALMMEIERLALNPDCQFAKAPEAVLDFFAREWKHRPVYQDRQIRKDTRHILLTADTPAIQRAVMMALRDLLCRGGKSP